MGFGSQRGHCEGQQVLRPLNHFSYKKLQLKSPAIRWAHFRHMHAFVSLNFIREEVNANYHGV